MNIMGSSKLTLSLKMTILSLFTASLLAGCGIRGSLKTPPPIFGGDKAEDSQESKTDDTDQNKTDPDTR